MTKKQPNEKEVQQLASLLQKFDMLDPKAIEVRLLIDYRVPIEDLELTHILDTLRSTGSADIVGISLTNPAE